jgi:hypothetical protein
MTNNETVVSIALIRAVFSSEFIPQLFGGAETHEPALRLVGQLVQHSKDDDLVTAIVTAALPDGYLGDILKELPSTIAGARKRGFDKKPEGKRKRTSTSDLLSTLVAQKKGAGPFHNEMRVAYLGIPTPDGGAINAPVGSERCNFFLQEVYYRKTGKALKTRERDEFTEHLRALAIFEGPRFPVFVRIGGDARAVYHDLGRDDGVVIAVTADGYVATSKPSAKLIRMQGMKALPLPHAGETAYSGLTKFKELLMMDGEQWPLVLAFLDISPRIPDRLSKITTCE